MLTPIKKQLFEIMTCDFGITDSTGKILISSREEDEKTMIKDFQKIIDSHLSVIEKDKCLYLRIKPARNKTHYVYVEKKEKSSEQILKLLGLTVSNFLKTYYDKHDKTFYVKQIVQNQLTDSELVKKASLYKINNQTKRVVMTVKSKQNNETSMLKILNNLFADNKKNYVVQLDNCDTLFIMEVEQNDEQQIVDTASSIVDTLEGELLIPIVVGIGKVANELSELTESYKTATTACDIGAVFEQERNIFSYAKLGIGLFVNKFNKEELQQFLEQIIDIESFNKLDEEIIRTIQKFFENSLNISETARKMYLHRNTLVYRIEKVLKQTGLDVRNFDDAILFKTAHMVKSYLEKLNDNT